MAEDILQQYESFLDTKVRRPQNTGRIVDPSEISEKLWPFNRDIVREAVRKGRFAVFADCGLAKTRTQLEWARLVRPTNGKALIVAPLGVVEQTKEEAEVLGMELVRVTAPSDAPFQITNYERLHNFVGCQDEYSALALDESSILKSVDGKTRTMLLQDFTTIPNRLACTATPAPNDLPELANHAEFVGAMSRPEMLASFFVHDSNGKAAGGWRLKGYAEEAFWRWVATWAVYVRRPSDIGHSDDGFILPPLRIHEETVSSDYSEEGALFPMAAGIQGARAARRGSLEERCERVAELVQASEDQAVVWHGLNDEGSRLAELLGDDAVHIEGATPEDDRIAGERAWRSGEVKTMITKPSLFGFGLNWQHCSRVYFLGIGHSYEQYYQAVRRCWRFGQLRPVDVRIVVSEAEADVVATVRRKEQRAAEMAEGIVRHMREAMMEELQGAEEASEYLTDEATGDGWRLMLGDCVERLSEVADGSVGLSVFSPPFASLYTYSASERDMGNCRDYEQFFEHFRHLAPELLRVTMPSRRCCVHVQQVSMKKSVDGVIGWYDFRADVVRMFVENGWIYDGEVVIDKDPQAQAIRTKSKALMFVQKNKDSAWSRPAMADYILLFRAPGENPEPVDTDVSNEEWILWARPIWYGIRESDTLNVAEARSEKDERHIAPLQLETIERCVRLWSNERDLILSPFAGIGSEGYVALQHGRRFVGIELKPEYWEVAQKNLRAARIQPGLFDEVAG